jgi:hypothetical protein
MSSCHHGFSRNAAAAATANAGSSSSFSGDDSAPPFTEKSDSQFNRCCLPATAADGRGWAGFFSTLIRDSQIDRIKTQMTAAAAAAVIIAQVTTGIKEATSRPPAPRATSVCARPESQEIDHS